jgi:signal transduction histidine kinase
MFKSIRSRLALSFAGIALVAALALGAVLLAILRNYYLNQETDYLIGNAQSVSKVVTAMMSASAPHDQVQSQIENLAFLTQTRIRVYAPDGQLLYDSGSPQNVNVDFGVIKQTLMESNDVLPKNKVFFSVGDSQTVHAVPAPSAGETDSKDFFLYRSVQAGGSAYGFALKLPGEASPVTARSNQEIMTVMLDPKNNEKAGSVQLSEGPAYGSSILASVARGWAFASAIAVLLAALIGWYISRRISAPVLALTDVTTRMTQGDLSSRADVSSGDEFGQLARSFNEMAARVEETVGTLRAFVADAAHELHTPLTALQTNLELAREETLAPGAHRPGGSVQGSADDNASSRFLLRAQEQSQRLEGLVKSLLDLSRIEAAESKSELFPVNLSRLVLELGEQFASRAEQTEQEFEINSLDENISVRGNPDQLRQVIINLLENALKFTPKDGRISVALEVAENKAKLAIADTGIGIPAEDLPHLFERFHRGRNAASYTGNGLGLAIVKAIVTAHGGTISAQSELGGGTQMIVSIPVYKEN